MDQKTICSFFPECAGCQFWTTPYPEQLEIKRKDLLKHLELIEESKIKLKVGLKTNIECIRIQEHGLRHRFDFTILNQQAGLYSTDKKFVPISQCLQLSPELEEVYQEFQKNIPPIQKGSVRLRVSPTGKKGVWLDFSNLDIKNILDEERSLTSLIQSGFQIEYGQKAKSIKLIEGTLKASEPTAEAWFQTFDSQGNSIPMLGFISSFTQPSWTSAKVIVQLIFSWLAPIQKENLIIEFGSGLGQYTLALLSAGYQVHAYDWDVKACSLLKTQAKNLSLDQQLKIFTGNYQNQKVDQPSSAKLILVNPARSGLKNFSYEILKISPQYIIYISCFSESLAADLEVLLKDGQYNIADVKLIDQFPQTKHYETCVLLQKN